MKKLFVIGVLLLGAGFGVWLHPELRSEVLGEMPMVGSSKTTQVYKWRDSRGNWHVTDKPPEEGLSVETLEYTANVNVLPLPPQLQD